MALDKEDREFRLAKISYLDFKSIEMDRVLTGLFERLEHSGYPSKFVTKNWVPTVEAFVDEMIDAKDRFPGFGQHREMVTRWVETHLMDLVNRGKRNQAVAGPRPLHGYTYRLRNRNHSRDYGASLQLYQMLRHARHQGHHAIEHLKNFFFDGFDTVTREINENAVNDIETATLLHFLSKRKDAADTKAKGEYFAPMCVGSADLLAEDVQRLLMYKQFMPRTVMVEYLKLLLAFHLALFHLRLLKMLPAWQKLGGANPLCSETACPMKPRQKQAPQGDCPYTLGLFVDLTGNAASASAALAEHSADTYYRRIPDFIRAYFVARKLDEFGQHLLDKGKIIRAESGSFSVGELFAMQGERFASERDKFFDGRLQSLFKSLKDEDGRLDPEIDAMAKLGLSDFDTYIEILLLVRGSFHRSFIVKYLDAQMLKNRAGALLAQGRGGNSARRFVLESRLLEVLLQIAVLHVGEQGHHTKEMRIDDLLAFLRERYGLYIDQLPPGDGFGLPSIDQRKALRANVQAFTARLREIGFYRDLSDAYVTQTVVPRYNIPERKMESKV